MKTRPAARSPGRPGCGVRVGEVSYVASQARPFPSGLMIGFRATAITEDITVDGEELLEARWFTRPSYASMPRITRSAAPTPSPATCSAPG